MTFKLDAAGASFVVMAIVPAAEAGAFGAKGILRDRKVFLRGVPPPDITRGIVGSNVRVCGCHDGMTIIGVQLF